MTEYSAVIGPALHGVRHKLLYGHSPVPFPPCRMLHTYLAMWDLVTLQVWGPRKCCTPRAEGFHAGAGPVGGDDIISCHKWPCSNLFLWKGKGQTPLQEKSKVFSGIRTPNQNPDNECVDHILMLMQ